MELRSGINTNRDNSYFKKKKKIETTVVMWPVCHQRLSVHPFPLISAKAKVSTLGYNSAMMVGYLLYIRPTRVWLRAEKLSCA